MHGDSSKIYVVGFSGGKDSVATWLYLTRELGLTNVVCTFADTGHESDVTYKYIKMLADDYGCPLVTVQPQLGDIDSLKPWKICWRLQLRQYIPWAPEDLSHEMEIEQERFFADRGSDGAVLEGWQNEPLNMERLATIKRRFPSPTTRFCTTYLKLVPRLRWLNANYKDLSQVVMASGVRAEESTARAQRSEWTDCDAVFGVPLWLPIHKWTHDEVFAIHKKYNIPPNPLYMQGCGRVGCFPCINARKSELQAISMRYPEAFAALSSMEQRVAESAGKPKISFFSHGKTPRRYESHVCEQSGERFPDAEDVRRWANGELPALSKQILMFEEDWTEDVEACVSQYGLCE